MMPLETATMLLLMFLAPAVWVDQKRHRIPNWICGALLIAGLVINGFFGGWQGLVLAAGGASLGFGLFVIPHLIGGMAAGDVKLMAAIGSVLGPALTLTAACTSLIFGACAGIALVAYNNWRDPEATLRALWVARFPYASVIAVGTSVALMSEGTSWGL